MDAEFSYLDLVCASSGKQTRINQRAVSKRGCVGVYLSELCVCTCCYEAGLSARRSDLSSILDRHSLAFDVGYCFTQTSAHKQRLFAMSDKESGVQERQR